MSEKHCDCGCIYLQAECPNCNRQSPQDRIKELEAENQKLRLGLEFYQRERDRFRHANPEMTGEYFLAGGHGEKYDSAMPQFVEICPAYGCAWVKIYEDTGRTISYEGS